MVQILKLTLREKTLSIHNIKNATKSAEIFVWACRLDTQALACPFTSSGF